MEKYMYAALKEAGRATIKNEVPVGAVAVLNGKIIARAHNLRESKNDPTAHAEILCLRRAAKKLKSWRLNNVTLYVTLEPCVMCMSAILQARIPHLVYGAADPKAGAHKSKIKLKSINPLRQKLKVTSRILKEDCAIILKKFFGELRGRKT
jgi:tRNA(adenine34) deaminase